MASRINKVPLTQDLGKKEKEKNMAEKTMTQVEALEIAAVAMENIDVEVADVLFDMAEKRRAPRKPRSNPEAEAFREDMVRVMAEAEGPMTNAELAEALEVKPQKIANNMRVLEKAGRVVRIRGEKASDKDRFALA
jgi:hypothetical protein